MIAFEELARHARRVTSARRASFSTTADHQAIAIDRAPRLAIVMGL
jgi:hypothetical protein